MVVASRQAGAGRSNELIIFTRSYKTEREVMREIKSESRGGQEEAVCLFSSQSGARRLARQVDSLSSLK